MRTTEWIGAKPSALQLGAILVVGITGVLMAGLQPLLLGMLAREGRISAEQLGHAATAELLIMGLASAYAGARWPTEQLRAIGVGCAVLLAVLNGLTTLVNGEAITLVRALAGVPSGVMIWITIAMIARSPTPERWSGLYLTLQTLAQFITAWTMESIGAPGGLAANDGFRALALLCCVAAVLAVLLPNRFAPLAIVAAQGKRPSARGLVALTVPLLWMAFIVGVWVYAEPLSRQAGHSARVVGTAVVVSLACQVLGGSVATVLCGRLRWFPTLMVCAVLNVACLLAFATFPSAALFLGTSALFGLLWLFTLPFMVPMVIAADPTRRAAVLIGGAELLGGSLGPLLASFLVNDEDARGAVALGAVALGGALTIMIALQRRARREQLTV